MLHTSGWFPGSAAYPKRDRSTVLVRKKQASRFDQLRRDEGSSADTDLPIGVHGILC